MKQKKSFAWIFATASVLVLVIGIYFGLAWYYSGRFCYGTWINGIYCTGMTVEEVNSELIENSTYEKLSVYDRHGDLHEIILSDIDYSMDYLEELMKIKAEQHCLKWIIYYFEDQKFTIMPKVSYSEAILATILDEAEFMHKEVLGENNCVEIIWTDEGYQLADHTVNQIVPEYVVAATREALHELKREVYLEGEGCYVTLEATQETLDTYELWKKIYSFQDFELTYVLGDREEVIDASVVAKWIALDETTGAFLQDENDELILDETKVLEYVTGLGEQYDTVGKPRLFMSTAGREVTIEKSTYGNDIDEEAECERLIEDFRQNRDGLSREPVYAQRAASQGANDVGGTYIEVDMTEQMLYYYVDYEIVLETSVVTGNMRNGWDTPSVACSVYGMARNRILRGANYATFVYYWMPVYGNIGLHDATWRRQFGDDIYMTDGSHGCVNMPKDMAAELYEMIEIGTPVFLFY